MWHFDERDQLSSDLVGSRARKSPNFLSLLLRYIFRFFFWIKSGKSMCHAGFSICPTNLIAPPTRQEIFFYRRRRFSPHKKNIFSSLHHFSLFNSSPLWRNFEIGEIGLGLVRRVPTIGDLFTIILPLLPLKYFGHYHKGSNWGGAMEGQGTHIFGRTEKPFRWKNHTLTQNISLFCVFILMTDMKKKVCSRLK